MEVLFYLVIIGIIVYILSKLSSLNHAYEDAITQIEKLKKRITQLETQQNSTTNKEKTAPQKVNEKIVVVEPAKTSKSTFVIPDSKVGETVIPTNTVSAPASASKPSTPIYKTIHQTATEAPIAKQPKVKEAPKPKKKSEFWMNLEKQFIENWTGILGSVIMVIGVGFLGIYAALKISALGRFILITGFAATLSALFFYLRTKPSWLKLALWLRSSAGAILLFACIGSIAIPGLKWVETEAMQLTILSLGIIVNLFLGYIGSNQALASLHVLLSLVGVWIIPSSPISLIVGGIITLFGIALTYREKWDYHLLLTISSFFAYHTLYWLSLHHSVSNSNRIIGIITLLIVSIAVALVHYREAYSNNKFEKIPFLVHLVNWFYFGLGLYLYSNGSQFSTITLAIGAMAAFLLARKARKLEIRWLYITDTLIAQLTAIISLATLYHWQVETSFIIAAIFIEGLLFLYLAKIENEPLLYKIGSISINLIGIALLYHCFSMIDYKNSDLMYKQGGSLLGAALFGTTFLVYAKRNSSFSMISIYKMLGIQINETTKHPLLGVINGLFFTSFYIHLYAFDWTIFSVVALLIAILWVRNKFQSIELSFATLVFLIGAHLVNIYQLYEIQDQSNTRLLINGLPILIASVVSIKYSYVQQVSKHLNWLGVYLFSIQLTLLSYYTLHHLSPLAVGLSWLLLSLCAIGTAVLLSKRSESYHQIDRYILHVGYLLIGLFLIQHLSVHVNSEALWGGIKGRIVVEIVAIIVLTLWAIATNRGNANYRSWRYLHPILVELTNVFAFSAITLELDYRYLALAWFGLAVINFSIAYWKGTSLHRLFFYSFVIFFLAIIQQLYIYQYIFTSSPAVVPTTEFTCAILFILFTLIYLVVFYKKAVLSNLNWPYLVSFLKPIGAFINRSAALLGIYVYGGFVLLITYYMFTSISEIIPGVVWLLLSALIASSAIYCHGKRTNFNNVDRYMMHLTYLYLLAFLIRHLLVHIQLESYVGAFKIRLLIEILAMGVFVYCATLKKPNDSTHKSWDYLHPLLIELLIFFAVFTIALEIEAIWQPLIWIALSFAFAFIGNLRYEKLSRLLFYSLVLYWAAAFQTIFVTSSYVVPSNNPMVQPWIYGSASLLFQFVFLVYFYLKCSFDKIVLPKSLKGLSGLIEKIELKRNLYVFYPLIICTAVFFFWTFDKSLLTLLWVLECLTIFIVSIVLKRQHFRYIALGALAVCIVRLIFFDLAQSSTLTRALVFLSVGIIMLIMNSLYNRFKSRFE